MSPLSSKPTAPSAGQATSKRGTPAVGRRFPAIPFYAWMLSSSALVLLFIFGPLADVIVSPDPEVFLETLQDKDVLHSVWLSLSTSAGAAVIALIFGTPLAYLLARREFRGKRLVESLIDLPIMIPHPVVGIALLSIAGRNHWVGELLRSMGTALMGSVTGIVTVLVFVGMPFFVDAVKAGMESVPPRLENVSRSLGASPGATFFRVTLPLSWRHLLVGLIMCMARALSEFGAIIIVAYHPMVAPVLMYERFTAYGLKYSQPVAVILILVSMLFFFFLRMISQPKRNAA